MLKRSESKTRILTRLSRSTKLLERVNKHIKCCLRCPFMLKYEHPNQYKATGFGDPCSSIILVGQSLHDYCPETPKHQIPFIGPMEVDSGDVLFKGIEQAGLRPEDLYITNVVKCHPPQNKPNEKEWERNCWRFLRRELEIIDPRITICLGRQAESAFLHYKAQTPFFAVPHPSYAMRCGQEKKWIKTFGDILHDVFDGIRTECTWQMGPHSILSKF